MKTTEILAYKREDLSKANTKKLRREAFVPGVLYGGKDVKHFQAPAILFRDLLYTPDSYFVDLNIEGTVSKCVLKDVQFHPVSENILHADFLEIHDDKAVTMDIPIELTGSAPGVQKGGKLFIKARKLKVKALPKDMPDAIQVDVSSLELGKSIKVEAIKAEGVEIITNSQVSIASVQIPRALRQAMQGEEGEEEAVEAE